MRFKNESDEDRMVQIKEGRGVSGWITIKSGETAELDPRIGRLNHLTEVVEAAESKAGPARVETKVKKKVESEKERLISVKGVNDEIAEAILLRFGNIRSALKAGAEGLMKVPSIGMARAKRIMSSLS